MSTPESHFWPEVPPTGGKPHKGHKSHRISKHWKNVESYPLKTSFQWDFQSTSTGCWVTIIDSLGTLHQTWFNQALSDCCEISTSKIHQMLCQCMWIPKLRSFSSICILFADIFYKGVGPYLSKTSLFASLGTIPRTGLQVLQWWDKVLAGDLMVWSNSSPTQRIHRTCLFAYMKTIQINHM